ASPRPSVPQSRPPTPGAIPMGIGSWELSRGDPCAAAALCSQCGWYWGPMNWEDAEMKLKGKPDGSFLVRDSSDPRYILSLSFRSQGITHHTRMEHYRGETFPGSLGSLGCHSQLQGRGCGSGILLIPVFLQGRGSGCVLGISEGLWLRDAVVPGVFPGKRLWVCFGNFGGAVAQGCGCSRCFSRPLISYIRKFYYYDPQEEQYLSLKEAQLISRQKQEPESST
ncbi:SOCS7 protein, partial [Molothrus ater]|nr:SOCS7 protein [Molothrus ater]